MDNRRIDITALGPASGKPVTKKYLTKTSTPSEIPDEPPTPAPQGPDVDARLQEMAKAADHGNRRGFRGRGPWTGVAWDIETGNEVGDCGHRHKVSTDEARNCPGLDRFDTIEVVTVRSDQLAILLSALAAEKEAHAESKRYISTLIAECADEAREHITAEAARDAALAERKEWADLYCLAVEEGQKALDRLRVVEDAAPHVAELTTELDRIRSERDSLTEEAQWYYARMMDLHAHRAAALADRDRYLRRWHGYHYAHKSQDCPVCFPATPQAPTEGEKCPKCGAPGPLMRTWGDANGAGSVQHFCDPYRFSAPTEGEP